MSVRPSSAALCTTCGTPLVDRACPRCALGEVLGDAVPIPAPQPPPEQIGDYDLLRQIGQGGMGTVWKARHRTLARTVALKLMGGKNASESSAALERFRREAGATAKLKHPNIVAIHEVGEAGGRLYLTMDFIEGESLAERIHRAPVPFIEAAAIIAKVARAVHHAHERDVLHRDIKPGNILLDREGEPYVCDFGLARIVGEQSSLTLTEDVIGTPAYISPEQAAGRVREISEASDIYSLGAVLYELLTGHPPFAAANLVQLVRMVVEDEPMQPASQFQGHRIPPDLATICLKCLQKDPASRYADALALAEDLERWLRHEPIFARPVARYERAWKWARRKPVLAALWLAVTILLIAVAVVANVMRLRVENQRRIAADLAETSRQRLARQLSQSAQHLISQHDWLRALPALTEAIEIGTGDPRLDEANRIRFGVLLRISPDLKNAWLGGDPFFRAEANQAGTRILLATRTHVEVWDTQAGVRVGAPFVPGIEIINASFDAASGKWAAIETAGDKCSVWRPDDGAVREVGTGRVQSPPDVYLLRENLFVLVLGSTWEVHAAMRDERIAGPFQHTRPLGWVVPLPGLRRVLACDDEGTLHTWDLTTGAEVLPPIALGKGGRGANLDGFNSYTRIALLHRSRECWVLNCVSGEITTHHDRLPDIPQFFGYTLQGDWLYAARNDDGVAIRDIVDDTLRWRASHGALGFRGSFAPDSGLVATQSWIGSTRVWRTDNGAPTSPMLWQLATPTSCILTPSGKWLLTRGDEPAVRLWQLPAHSGARRAERAMPGTIRVMLAGSANQMICIARDGMVRLWETTPDIREARQFQHPGDILAADSVSRGRLLFTACENTAALHRIQDGAPHGRPHTPGQPIVHAAASSDGALTAAALRGGGVIVWHVRDGEEAARIPVKAERVAFSPDGRLLLTIGAKSAQTWDARTGRAVSAPVDEPGGSVFAEFSPDSRHLVQWNDASTAAPSRARIWDAATGRVLLTLPPHWLGIRAAAWSPDSTRIVTGGGDHTIHLCDARTGAVLIAPIRVFQKIARLGFSPDGLLLWSLVASELLIHDTASGEPVMPRVYALQKVEDVAWGADGLLATVGADSAPMLWDFTPERRSPEDLRTIANMLSGHALVGGTSSLAPLKPGELRETWERARPLLDAWPQDGAKVAPPAGLGQESPR